jgi:hypothetical protein
VKENRLEKVQVVAIAMPVSDKEVDSSAGLVKRQCGMGALNVGRGKCIIDSWNKMRKQK